MDGELSSSRGDFDGGGRIPRRSNNRRGRGGGGGYRGGGGGSGPRYGDRRANYHHRGGGRGGGGGGRRGGGGGFGRGRGYNPHHHSSSSYSGGRGGGGHRGGDRGGGGPRGPANRVDADTTSKKIDPEQAMVLQLSAMLAKLGELNYSPQAAAGGGESSSSQQNQQQQMRPDVGRNARELAQVLCTTNPDLFLTYESTSAEVDADNDKDNDDAGTTTAIVSAEDAAGPTARLLIQCASTLPLQTPGYVALTAAMEQMAPATHGGFAQRCITYACHVLIRDLCHIIPSSILSCQDELDDDYKFSSVPMEMTISYPTVNLMEEQRQTCNQAIMRVKLLLRYFALMSKIGLIRLLPSVSDDEHSTKLQSFMGLLDFFTTMAERSSLHVKHLLKELKSQQQSQHHQDSSTSSSSRLVHLHVAIPAYRHLKQILCYWVLSSLPHVTANLSSCLQQQQKDEDDVKTQIHQHCSSLLVRIKKLIRSSTFSPEKGMLTLYLKREEYDPLSPTEEDDDEEDDEEDGDDDETNNANEAEDELKDDDNDTSDPNTASCADTLQELLRVCLRLEAAHWEVGSTIVKETVVDEDGDEDEVVKSCGIPHFCTLSDTPWEGLLPKTKNGNDDDDMQEEEEKDDDNKAKSTRSFEAIALKELKCLCLPTSDNSDEETILLRDFGIGAVGANDGPTEEEDQDFFNVGASTAGTTKVGGDDGTSSSSKNKALLTNHQLSTWLKCISLATSMSCSQLLMGRFPILDDDSPIHSSIKTFLNETLTPSDRFYWNESIRETMFAHCPSVAGHGGEYTTLKDAASHVLGVIYLFPIFTNATGALTNGDGEDTSSTGNDGTNGGGSSSSGNGKEMFLLMETLLGSIVQCSSNGTSTCSPINPTYGTTFTMQDSLFYLGRIIVDLCKLAPTTFPAAIAVGVGLIVEELSTVTPAVRSRLAQWFAFHLSNTDFQWPYWGHWDKYAAIDETSSMEEEGQQQVTLKPSQLRSSKSRFLVEVFDMCRHVFSSQFLIQSCLPSKSPLSSLVPSSNNNGLMVSSAKANEGDATMESEGAASATMTIPKAIDNLRLKICLQERPDDLSEWITSDDPWTEEVTQSNEEASDYVPAAVWRSHVTMNAILESGIPTVKGAAATGGGGGITSTTNNDVHPTQDVLNGLIDSITRYHPVLQSAMIKDESLGASRDDVTVVVVTQLHKVLSGNGLFFSTLLTLLLDKIESLTLLSVVKFVIMKSSADNTVGWNVAMESTKHFADSSIADAVSKFEEEREDQMDDDDDDEDDEDDEAKTSNKRKESKKDLIASGTILNPFVERINMVCDCMEYVTSQVPDVVMTSTSALDDKETSGATSKHNKASPRNLLCIEGFRSFLMQTQLCFMDMLSIYLNMSRSSLLPPKLTSCIKAISSTYVSDRLLLSTTTRTTLNENDKSNEKMNKKLVLDTRSALHAALGTYVA